MVIWKFELPTSVEIAISIPKGAEILTVQVQGSIPQMWIKVPDPKAPTELRYFQVLPTGAAVDDEGHKYVATFQAVTLVFHVFEVFPPKPEILH